MQDILKNEKHFADNFCSQATVRNLQGLPLEALRTVLLELHKCVPFTAAGSPTLSTPEDGHQTVIVIGNPDVEGKMRPPKFGICTNVAPGEQGEADDLYLWAHKELLNSAAKATWKPWRNEGKDRGCFFRAESSLIDSQKKAIPFEKLFDADQFKSLLQGLCTQISVCGKVREEFRHILEKFGHSDDVITPFIIDYFRHPDSNDVDEEGMTKAKAFKKRRTVSKKAPDQRKAYADGKRVAIKTPHGPRSVVKRRFDRMDFFNAVKATPPGDKVTFLNLSFKSRVKPGAQFNGGGLYGFFYRTDVHADPSLIYVGLFKNGNDRPVFEGNIVAARWNNHIAAFSARGKNIGISERTAQSLRALPEPHELQSIADPSISEILVRDRGCQAGENKIFFSKKHWDFLGDTDGEELLSRFSFSYVQLKSGASGEMDGAIRNVIENAEKNVIKHLAPYCNYQTKRGQHASNVTMSEFEELAELELNG